jgi:hypothetical protein
MSEILPRAVGVEGVEEGDGLDVWGQSNPRSLFNMVPKRIQEVMLQLRDEYPEWVGMGENEARKALKPNDTEDALRLSFWIEYNRVQDTGTKFVMTNVYGPVCSLATFYENYVKRPKTIAWLIIPPQEYMRSLESYLNEGKETLGKILRMDVFDSKGKIDPRRAKIFLAAFQMVENRVMGAVTQRIEQKTRSLHLHKEIASSPENESLVAEYQQLKQKYELDKGPVGDIVVPVEAIKHTSED